MGVYRQLIREGTFFLTQGHFKSDNLCVWLNALTQSIILYPFFLCLQAFHFPGPLQ